MKNRELIEILSKQDPDDEVFLEYDSMCCVYSNFYIVKAEANPEARFAESGIYLMAEHLGNISRFFTRQELASKRGEPTVLRDEYLSHEILKEPT